jgi:hypothetical protein
VCADALYLLFEEELERGLHLFAELILLDNRRHRQPAVCIVLEEEEKVNVCANFALRSVVAGSDFARFLSNNHFKPSMGGMRGLCELCWVGFECL